jgi:hypothetical protein
MKLRNVFLATATIIAATACRIVSALPPPPCPIENLLLDKSLFHEEFSRGIPDKDSAPARFGIDKIGVGFGTMTKGGAVQDVYLGGSTKEAQEEFVDWAKWDFSSREGWTEWYIPGSFNYQSPVADQYRFACYKHIASGVETCQAIGQYGPYLTRFHTDLSTILTYQDLERMLQAIDEKAARCLEE